jgi:tRNA modification GTPase
MRPVVERSTIAAPATAPGKAGVAVVRVSGPRALAALAALVGRLPPPRVASLARLRDGSGETIDEALVIGFPGPASFTGEDVAEFHVHGSPAVLRRLLAVLIDEQGCTAAGPGAFTRRAFENGRLDLLKAETIADLIDSQTERQRRQAIAALGGAQEAALAELRAHFVEALAGIEASLDFGDEDDVPADVTAGADRIAAEIVAALESLVKRSRAARELREGVTIAVLGAPNAGKSSLVNALVGRRVALVSDVPGTTRDRIEATIDLGGYAFRLVDTAGLRTTEDPLEAEGIALSLEAAMVADVVLWLDPEGDWSLMPAAIRHRAIRVRSKVDLIDRSVGTVDGEEVVGVSVVADDGIKALVERLIAEAQRRDPANAVVFTHERQIDLLERAAMAVGGGRARLDSAPELFAFELRHAAELLDGLVGCVTSDEVLAAVFGRFCIGK